MIGGAFMFIAGFGTLRLADFGSRVHSAAKAGTVGLCSFLIAAVIKIPASASVVVVIIIAVLVTVPAGTHLLVRAVDRDAASSKT